MESKDLLAEKHVSLKQLATLCHANSEIEPSGLDHIISASLHWHRKAAEAEVDVDRLLFYWISIENLVNPGESALNAGILTHRGNESVQSIAFEILPRLAAENNAYRRGWVVFMRPSGGVGGTEVQPGKKFRMRFWSELT